MESSYGITTIQTLFKNKKNYSSEPARKAFRGAYKWERERRNKADIKERERERGSNNTEMNTNVNR